MSLPTYVFYSGAAATTRTPTHYDDCIANRSDKNTWADMDRTPPGGLQRLADLQNDYNLSPIVVRTTSIRDCSAVVVCG